MKALLSWLQDFVKIEATPSQIVEKLSLAGLEIESLQNLGKNFSGVYTATLLKRDKHPQADRLSVCEVRCGDEVLTLVCGANNMKAGDKVALAKPGAKLPNGMEITETVIRQVKSSGMLCSEKELGLAETSEGILILPPEAPEALPLAEYLKLDDVLMEVNVTPNRGDCLSMLGLAREMAANFSLPFQPAFPQIAEKQSADLPRFQVKLADENFASRYACRVLRGVKVGSSPRQLQQRLEACGIRPINNIVDATNYVMLELGQPMHAFDLQKIQGSTIQVRPASNGEKILALDDKVYDLSPGDCVIADEGQALAIAGVMGGQYTSVQNETTDLLLESACFNPQAIRQTVKRLGLASESSYRFERGVDPELGIRALHRLTELIGEMTPIEKIGEIVEAHSPAPTKALISFRPARLAKILGESIPNEVAREILSTLGCRVQETSKEIYEVAAPSYRPDLTREIDLIEEIARIYGYDRLPSREPTISLKDLNQPRSFSLSQREALRQQLAAWGFVELIHYAFTSEDLLKSFNLEVAPQLFLQNPISEDLGVLRPSLLPQMLQSIRKNLFHGKKSQKVFELRPVFSWNEETKKIEENWHLVLGMVGERRPLHFLEKPEISSFFDLQGYVQALFQTHLKDYEYVVQLPETFEKPFLHPKRQGRLKATRAGESSLLGYLGELHPQFLAKWDLNTSIVVAEINLQLFLTPAEKWIQFQEVSPFPTTWRDLNLIVSEEVLHADILGGIESFGGVWIKNIELYDLYRGEPIPKGKKALTYRIEYGDRHRTLTDEEVNQARETLLQALKEKLDASLR